MAAPQQGIVTSIEEAAKELKAAAAFIGQRVINREEVIEQAVCALLTGEHLLLQSRTGVGKSLLAEQLFSMFEGAKIFRVQASKEQQPDTYFGGLDLDQLKTGRIAHNTTDSLVESEFGFIDEIFDANDFTLRALLSLLNERRLIRGVQNIASPLHSVIAATNYLRVSEVTEGLLDRFLFKAVILPDKDPFIQYQISQRYLVHAGRTAAPPKRIPFSRLKKLHDILRNRALSGTVKHSDMSDFYISPRTQAKSLDLLRALALLKGRSNVTHEDVSKLYFVFATVGLPEETAMFKKACTTVLNSLTASRGFDQITVLLDFTDLLERIRQEPSILNQPLSQMADTNVKLSFFEWVKERFTGTQPREQNRKLLEQFVHDFVPACDEVRELKHSVERTLQQTMVAAERELSRPT
jgi:MoxR-like ATPase